MKQYSEEEKQYFRKHIKEFTLKEKSELIDSNLKDIIIHNLINICENWPDKKIRLKAFEMWKDLFDKYNLINICEYWNYKKIRLKAFEMWKDLFNKYNLIDICEYWLDKKNRLEAKKLLNNNQVTKDNFITNK